MYVAPKDNHDLSIKCNRYRNYYITRIENYRFLRNIPEEFSLCTFSFFLFSFMRNGRRESEPHEGFLWTYFSSRKFLMWYLFLHVTVYIHPRPELSWTRCIVAESNTLTVTDIYLRIVNKIKFCHLLCTYIHEIIKQKSILFLISL